MPDRASAHVNRAQRLSQHKQSDAQQTVFERFGIPIVEPGKMPPISEEKLWVIANGLAREKRNDGSTGLIYGVGILVGIFLSMTSMIVYGLSHPGIVPIPNSMPFIIFGGVIFGPALGAIAGAITHACLVHAPVSKSLFNVYGPTCIVGVLLSGFDPLIACIGSALCLTIISICIRLRYPPKRGNLTCCHDCGYDLFGLDTELCPECGAPHPLRGLRELLEMGVDPRDPLFRLAKRIERGY